MDYDGLSDEAATLATIQRHKDEVGRQIQKIIQELERRALTHDASKLGPEELPGFCRINRVARETKYGSPEYRASMAEERETIDHHTSNNSHHPEYHLVGLPEPSEGNADSYGLAMDRAARGAVLSAMPFMDLIEMVCDWHAAAATYGSGKVDLEAQRARFPFTDSQWWLVEKLSEFLEAEPPGESKP